MKYGEYIANSYEHEEDGYTTEDAGVRVAQVDKRLKKGLLILQKAMQDKDPLVKNNAQAAITMLTKLKDAESK